MNLFVALIVGLGVSSSALAADPSVKPGESVSLNATVDIVNRVQEHQNQVDYLMAPIKSAADLKAYLASMHGHQSPIDRLSPAAKERFLSGLRFGDTGLTSFPYAELETELSATEIYRILSLFGAQHTTSLLKNARQDTPTDHTIMETPINSPYDYRDFWCLARATCAKSLDYICTGNC